jgi:O-antigen ligase
MQLKKVLKYILGNLPQLFLCCFVFFAPFNISTVFYTTSSLSSGFFSPYLSVNIYLADMCFLFSMLLFAPRLIKLFACQTFQRSFVVLLGLALLSVLVSSNYPVVVFYFLRLLGFLFFVFMVRFGFVKKKLLILAFISSVSLLAFLGILQFIFQSGLGLSFFGEPNIAADSLSTAKFSFSNVVFLRPYSLTLHPNILAGFSLVGFFVTFQSGVIKNEKLKYLLSAVLLSALVLSFSRSATLALLISLLCVFGVKSRLKYVMFFLLILFVSSFFIIERSGISERFELLVIAREMFFSAPFLGVGAGNFTAAMQDFTVNKLLPWEFQPVHNIYLLVLCEMGIVGLLCLILFLWSLFKKLGRHSFPIASLLSLLIIGLFDHYLFTLFPGQFLFSFVVALVVSK